MGRSMEKGAAVRKINNAKAQSKHYAKEEDADDQLIKRARRALYMNIAGLQPMSNRRTKKSALTKADDESQDQKKPTAERSQLHSERQSEAEVTKTGLDNSLNFEEELYKKIGKLVENADRNSEQRPQFSTPEMIVIALIMSGKALSATEILSYILQTFKYYCNLAAAEYAKAILTKKLLDESEMVIPDFTDAFNCFEVPLYSAYNNEAVSSASVRSLGFHVKTSAAQVRLFFRSWVGYDRPRANNGSEGLDLFSLPIEVRNIIYEMVLVFPYPGVFVRPEGFKVFRRNDEQVRFNGGRPPLDTLPVQTVLALLLVNKQIHEETLPRFYSANTFFFDSVHEYAAFARHTTPKRLDLLRHVFIFYQPKEEILKGYPSAAKILSQHTELRSLELGITDIAWLHSNPSVQQRTYFSRPQDLPGVQDIAYSLNRVASFKITGNCPTIKAFLEQEVAKMKEAERSKEVKRLRFAEMLKQAPSFKEAARLKKQRHGKLRATFNTSMTDSGTSYGSEDYGKRNWDMYYDLSTDEELDKNDVESICSEGRPTKKHKPL